MVHKSTTAARCYHLIHCRPVITLLIAAAIVCSFSTTANAQETPASDHWVASWGASPFAFLSFNNATPPASFKNQTIRQIMRISTGGEQLRVRFSNEIGDTPLTIGAASVALVDKESSIKSGSLRQLTFGGSNFITIPPGAPAVSDPVDLSVAALSELAVSIYLPNESAATTVHMGRTAFVSSDGNHTQTVELPDAEKTTTMAFLTGIYVNNHKDTGVIVAFGDSITDGAASTPHTFNNWPQYFAERLARRSGTQRNMAVINHGISGNQLLQNGAGQSALGRYDRDVLSTPGLTHVVVLIGINDIGTGGMRFPGSTGPVPDMRTPAEIIAGYQQLITRAHTMTPPVKIYGATLTPFEGTFAGYYTPEKDETRQTVNHWIRTSGMFDGVIDFDQAIRDPGNPGKMADVYNSGDNLHPGDAGYKKMADSIDLDLFE
jgi:lysophospholipase L1-like esterase